MELRGHTEGFSTISVTFKTLFLLKDFLTIEKLKTKSKTFKDPMAPALNRTFQI